MPDSLIRPLTLGDKLRHIADIADRDSRQGAHNA
jgi:hypothetical protein